MCSEPLTPWEPLSGRSAADAILAQLAIPLMEDALADLRLADAIAARLQAGEVLWADEAIAAGEAIDRAMEIRSLWVLTRPDEQH